MKFWNVTYAGLVFVGIVAALYKGKWNQTMVIPTTGTAYQQHVVKTGLAEARAKGVHPVIAQRIIQQKLNTDIQAEATRAFQEHVARNPGNFGF